MQSISRWHSGSQSGLRDGDKVEVFAAGGARALGATIVALDARMDPTTGTPWCGRELIEGALWRGPRRLGPGARAGRATPEGGLHSGQRPSQGAGRRSGIRDRAGSRAEDPGACAVRRKRRDGRRRGPDPRRPVRRRDRWPRPAPSSCVTRCWWRRGEQGEAQHNQSARRLSRARARNKRGYSHALITDIFIKHPVLAVVVNLVIILVGWRALTALPVQQYPKSRARR